MRWLPTASSSFVAVHGSAQKYDRSFRVIHMPFEGMHTEDSASSLIEFDYLVDDFNTTWLESDDSNEERAADGMDSQFDNNIEPEPGTEFMELYRDVFVESTELWRDGMKRTIGPITWKEWLLWKDWVKVNGEWWMDYKRVGMIS